MITVIIPTYNRPSYAIRLIEFYLNFNFIKLIVLDSSHKKILKNKYSINENIKVVNYSSSIFLSDKIIDSASYIDTDYVVLCADDDTLVPKSLKECMLFLDNNPDFVSAQGRYYPHIFIQPKQTNNYNMKFFENQNYNNRINNYLKFKHGNTLYALHRTATFRSIWNKKFKSIRKWEFHEFLTTIVSLSYGKSKNLNLLYHVRTLNNYNFVGGDIKEIYSKIVLNDFEQDLNLVNKDLNINLYTKDIKNKIFIHGQNLFKLEQKIKYKFKIKVFLKIITFKLSNIFFDNKQKIKVNIVKFIKNLFSDKLDTQTSYELNLIYKSYKKTYFKEINFTRFHDIENT